MSLFRWPPWRRRRRSQVAVYNADNSTLTIRLEEHIGADRFTATRENFASELGKREGMSDQVRLLLAELFHRGALNSCKIEFGTRLTLGLVTHNVQGHRLLVGARLEHFQAIFSEITGHPIAAAWQDSGPTVGSFGIGSGIDATTVADVFALAVRGTLEGLKIAAAAKILGIGS